jgi:hypothetical protein
MRGFLALCGKILASSKNIAVTPVTQAGLSPTGQELTANFDRLHQLRNRLVIGIELQNHELHA